MTDRHIFAIYCDDIRMEVGNKQSYIGVYNGELIVDSLPAVLPKICVSVRVTTSSENPFKDLKIVASLDQTVINEITINPADIPHSPDYSGIAPLNGEENQSFIVVAFVMMFATLVVEKASRLRIRAYSGDEVLKAGSLLIRQFSEEERNGPLST